MKHLSFNQVALLLVTFVVYSCTSLFSKSASMHPFLSVPYLLNFGGMLCCMGVYAILWQKVLGFMALNKAFLFKSMTIVMILGFCYFLFGETITMNNIIGTAFIIAGLVVLAWKK